MEIAYNYKCKQAKKANSKFNTSNFNKTHCYI